MPKPRLRFAPSPTGSPHIGTVRTAVFDYLYAEHTGGAFILRIEDTDRTRYVEGSLEEIMHSLRWLGMQWDEGPEVGGDYGPYFQSERLELYQQHAGQLVEEGKAYCCYCAKERLEQLRKQQEAAKAPIGYDRRCRNLNGDDRARLAAENPDPVIRFAMKTEGVTEFDDVVRGRLSFDNALQDDLVIIKADGFPTYNFANVVDDHLMEITHVIRGEEFISSTPKHVQMYEAFGWTPPRWVSVSLILDTAGRKLAKRSGISTAIVDYIEAGYLPDAMLNFLATMGWSAGEDRKLYSREELIERFTLEGLVNHPAVYDIAKLDDLNGEYVRMMSVEQFADAILPRLQSAGWIDDPPTQDDRAYLLKVAPLVQERLVVLSQAPDVASYFYADPTDYDEKGIEKSFRQEHSKALLETLSRRTAEVADWRIEQIEAAVRGSAQELGLKDGAAIHATRLAITGRTGGPGLFELMEVIGKERCIARLERALTFVGAGPRARP